MPSTRSRAFAFTWNNYPEGYRNILVAAEARYFCFGVERAPTTGTMHLQGYIYFGHARTVTSIRALLPGCHVEVARGTFLQNRVYCSKGGDFHEFGVPPVTDTQRGDSEFNRWVNAWTAATQGHLEEIPADIRIRYYGTFKRIVTDYMPAVPQLTQPCGIWIHGESGCGKTRSVVEAYPHAFPKPRNQWWDGYQHEEVVYLDDIDVFDKALGGKLKHWADCYAFIAEIKGGSLKIRPKKFIVTSQYRIDEIWEDLRTVDALLRRFTIVEKEKGQNIII